ncbi:MAG: hypothetical protein H7Z37_13330 [Pyrinomonadaceae bacterium]|nr:hypothetical protein [Pyrinomonadaceae bacterium]
MKYTKLLLLFLFLSIFQVASVFGQGSICIPALPGLTAKTNDLPMTPPGQFISPNSTLSIQVDKRKPAIVSLTSSGEIKGLSLKGRHLLKIRRDGKTVTSFWFSFEKEGEKDLCLWYYKGYGTFSIKPAKDCKCGK